MNTTCPTPTVLPSSYSLTSKPGHKVRRFLVVFLPCGDPSPPVDYVATARISAPGDTNPANDSLSATVDVRPRFGLLRPLFR